MAESTQDSIQLFTPTFRVEECLDEIRECLISGWTGLGYKTLEIEQAWTEYTGLPHSHFLNSATAGLHLAFELLKEQGGWGDEDEVITTPLTFVSTNHAILHSRLLPVFADVDEYLCLDPDSVRSRITARTRAVVFVGMGGNTGQLADIVDICRSNGLALVLDAAHMAGTKLSGKDPGLLADVACYSFQAVKNLPTADSGMVCFDDPELDAAARKMSWLGISKDTYARASRGTYAWLYDVDKVGYKYHGNSIMASLALVGLKYLDDDNQRRRELASHYDAVFANAPQVRPVRVAPDCQSSRHLYQVRVSNRERVIGLLQEQGIYPGVHYRDNTDYPMYRGSKGQCPLAHKAATEILSLPMHLQLSDSAARRIATIITS